MLTGASGITALSPAMSFAGGRLVFSAYENDGYNIYALDTAEQLAGEPAVDLPRNAAVLPPRQRGRRSRGRGAAGRRRGACRGTEVPVREPLQAEVEPGFRGAADVRRRRRSVRDVCGRRRLVPLQRHARQSRDRHGRPGDEPLRRVRGHVSSTSIARIAGTGARRSTRRRTCQRAFQAGFVGNTYVEQEYRYLQRDQAPPGSSPIRSAGPGASSSPAAIVASARATT